MPANHAMVQLLVALVEESARPLAPGLAGLVQGDVVEEDGCWFLRPLRESAGTVSPESFPDRTGFECFVNHVHIGDFVEDEDVNERFRQGLRWAESLRKKLEGHGRFNIIVSCDEVDCSVRFHRVRPTELWLVDDLETYLEASVLVIPVGR